MIAPLAIVLRQQGEDVKVVYIGNRHESTLVTRKDLTASSVADLAGYTVAVPMRYSGHNICIQELIKKEGVTGKVKVVEMNPPDMASALATGSLDAYFVGEPFAAQSIRNGSGRLVFYVEEVWPEFICNLMLVRQEFIARDTDVVRALVWGGDTFWSVGQSGIPLKACPVFGGPSVLGKSSPLGNLVESMAPLQTAARGRIRGMDPVTLAPGRIEPWKENGPPEIGRGGSLAGIHSGISTRLGGFNLLTPPESVPPGEENLDAVGRKSPPGENSGA